METNNYFYPHETKSKFEIIILEEAENFISSLDINIRKKVIYNMDKATYINDPKLFKKLNSDIWEFRTKYMNQHYRFFAFWDRTNNLNTLVITTHGMIKKVSKVPKSEIIKSEKIRFKYFENKSINQDDKREKTI